VWAWVTPSATQTPRVRWNVSAPMQATQALHGRRGVPNTEARA